MERAYYINLLKEKDETIRDLYQSLKLMTAQVEQLTKTVESLTQTLGEPSRKSNYAEQEAEMLQSMIELEKKIDAISADNAKKRKLLGLKKK